MHLNLGWMSAVREGNAWEHFLEYDFGTMVRLNKIVVGQPATIAGVDVRSVAKIRVMYSYVSGMEPNELLFLDIEDDNEIVLDPALETRYIRLVVVQATDGTPDSTPVGING